jgi:outer membrane protein assembly factor BamB
VSISPPLAVKWKLRLQTGERTLHAFNPPVVKDDTIYFGSADGNFYALDIESGYMRWVFKTGASINSVPYADDKQVYFGSQDGKTYAVSREEGLESWNFRAGSPVNSTVTRYKDYIIFTTNALGASFFLSPEGEKLFHIPNLAWYNHTYQMYDDIMYFAPGPVSRPSSFGPYDINTKKYHWILTTRELNAYWYSFSAVTRELVFFSTLGYDGYENWYLDFYAYDRLSGDKIWHNKDDARWGNIPSPDLDRLLFRGVELLDFMSPSVWKDLVIYSGGDNVVRAFDAKTGVVRWEEEFTSPISSAPTIAGDRIYFGLLGNAEEYNLKAANLNSPPELVCLSARNGRVLWRMELEGAIMSAPVIAGKRIMFGTDKSMFYILEEVL